MPRYEQFHLPDAGEGLTEADIVEWRVAVGDRVRVNQPVVEIETAKSLVELPSPYDGVVTELHVDQGVTVDVGVPIMTFDVDPDGVWTPAAGSGATGSVTVSDGDADARAGTRGEVPGGAGQVPGSGVEGSLGDRVSTGSDAAAVVEVTDGAGSGSVLVGYGTFEGAVSRRAGRCSPGQGPLGQRRLGRPHRPAVTRRRRPCWPSRRCASWRRTSASGSTP